MKAKKMIAAYYGGNKKNWVGSANSMNLIEVLINQHMEITGRKRKEYKTFVYTEDQEKLEAPRG